MIKGEPMSNKIRVNFHSFVDIITNSSTVIFTYVNSVDAVRQFIDAVLEISGAYDASHGITADDLYDFKIRLDPDSLEHLLESALEDEDHEYHAALSAIDTDPQYEDKWLEKWETMLNYLADNIDPDDAPTNYDGFDAETQLVITPKKPGYRDDLGKLIAKIFSHEATRDG
jgi:hypothetical protein